MGVVKLLSLGNIPGPSFLDGRTGDGTVGLTSNAESSGTRWELIIIQEVRGQRADVVLECLGDIPGPRFLDGRTGDGTVGLVPGREPVFTGTKWELRYIYQKNDYFTLECKGDIRGPRFLDGRTADGTVGLAPFPSDRFSGTKWKLLQL